MKLFYRGRATIPALAYIAYHDAVLYLAIVVRQVIRDEQNGQK